VRSDATSAAGAGGSCRRAASARRSRTLRLQICQHSTTRPRRGRLPIGPVSRLAIFRERRSPPGGEAARHASPSSRWARRPCWSCAGLSLSKALYPGRGRKGPLVAAVSAAGIVGLAVRTGDGVPLGLTGPTSTRGHFLIATFVSSFPLRSRKAGVPVSSLNPRRGAAWRVLREVFNPLFSRSAEVQRSR
jgi:hypothetical protein